MPACSQGNVPLALHALFPAANISKEGWLDVFDPLFARIQDAYMQRLFAAYGNTTHWCVQQRSAPHRKRTPPPRHRYEADGLFASTGGPWAPKKGRRAAGGISSVAAPDPDARTRSRAAYDSFAKHDPAAIWVYQVGRQRVAWLDFFALSVLPST